MSKLTHRNNKAQANHSLYQTNLLSDQTQILTDIRTNTANVNVNTDTLEALIGTDTSGTPLSLTALTRVQKDLLDNKLGQIAAFLDKDNSQFHLKHHPDDHHVMLAGNTAADGSGTKNHAHVDGSGVLKVSQVSSQNVQPSNIANADHASHSQSLAVGIRARTNITDETSGKFLLCDSSGHLQCDISNQPNFKLEDLSSSLNAQHASGGTRSIAVGLKGKTDITDPSTSTFLKCSSAGELVNNNSTKNADTTHASVAVSISSNGVDGQITLGDTDNYVRYLVDGSASLLYAEGSQDNSNFIRLGQIPVADVGGLFHGTLLIENPPKYVRLKNYDLSSIGIKIQAIYGRK